MEPSSLPPQAVRCRSFPRPPCACFEPSATTTPPLVPLWLCGCFQSANKLYDTDVVGIDTGITMVMAENARTGFVWDTFMKNPEARRGMANAGFKPHQPSNG